MKTLFILCCHFFGLLSALAGSGDSITVINVKEIRVFGSRYDYFTEGQQLISVSPQLLKFNRTGSLGELLGQNGLAYIKSYGAAGSLSTISIRGANANQTQLNWNGFPLNSITTGDADLSLIPVQFIDELTIHPGASGSLYGSGTFGGSVDITNRTRESAPLSVFLDSEIGSFHNRSLSAGFSQGFKKLTYSFCLSLRSVLNDFSYPDDNKPGIPDVIASHNSMKYFGAFHSLSYNPNSQNKIELGIWYQEKMKDLPQLMGALGTKSASQKDSSLKIFAKWTRIFSHSALTVKSAYFTDYLQYLDKDSPVGINSQIFSRQLLSDLSFRNYFSEHLSAEFGFVSRLLSAAVSSYSHNIFEPRISLYSAVRASFGPLSMNFSLREEFSPDKRPKPVFNFGANYNLLKDFLTLRLASSSKYRLPSLNEKYWPGCNPGILPEEGWTNEAGFVLKLLKKSASELSFESQLYSSRMKNLIQWNDQLVAVNFKDVWSRGIESHLHYLCHVKTAVWESNLGMEHLSSTNIDVFEGRNDILGKQLRYVPQNRLSLMSELRYTLFNLGYLFSYTGRAYITEDNSGPVLPAFAASNIFAGIEKNISGNEYLMTFRISNLMNNHYQVISGYPVPGRAFYLSVSVRFDVIRKNKNSLL